jgi:enamine deaminase RidA (YjgF/YER057c/UK114 family)
VANYSPWVLHDGVLYLSGVGGRSKIFGKLGGEVSIDEGYTLAREAALMHIAAMKEALGDLDRVERILHLVGYVSCTPDFADQPRVIDGATDIFAGLFGEAGLPARAAIGVMSLPFNIPVEIETMVAVRAG